MPECIFCRKIKDEKMFNAEHIILDSLGGNGEENICRNVCIECNSSLGTRVDAGMVNETITKYVRYLFKIKGRTVDESIGSGGNESAIRNGENVFSGRCLRIRSRL